MLELRVKDRGRRLKTLRRLKLVLEGLGLPFQIEDVVDEGDEILVVFDADEEALLQALIAIVFRQTPDGRELFSRSSIFKKSKRVQGPTKKKAAPRRKATTKKKKAPAKKK